MIQWRPFAPWLTAALAIGLGIYYNHTTNTRLAVERARTEAARDAYIDAKNEAIGLEIVAMQANQRADSIEAARAKAAPARTAVVKAAPKDCQPAIDALEGENTDLKSELAARKDAFTEQKQATAVLAPAADHLADAAHALVKASKPSFWAHLKPDVGLGATAGVDPSTGKFSKAVGITLSWKVL